MPETIHPFIEACSQSCDDEMHIVPTKMSSVSVRVMEAGDEREVILEVPGAKRMVVWLKAWIAQEEAKWHLD